MPSFWKITEKAFCGSRLSIELRYSPKKRSSLRTRIQEINSNGGDLLRLSRIGAKPFRLQTNPGKNQPRIQPRIPHFSRSAQSCWSSGGLNNSSSRSETKE